MKCYLLWFLAATSTSYATTALDMLEAQGIMPENSPIKTFLQGLDTTYTASKPPIQPWDDIRRLLAQPKTNLTPRVIDKVVSTLNCAQENHVAHNHILTVIDYSLPSNQKRLWVFDLKKKKQLFYTYVAHGINSGQRESIYFSNKYNSKASSIGVYKTDASYYGREGLSLRLSGLEQSFNDNASNRAIVMHAGWYVEEDFIKKYGRAGRSWGCPALPHTLAKPIINTIKDNSLFVVYYPSDDWFLKSKFLNCRSKTAETIALTTNSSPIVQPITEANTVREEIIFADLNKNNRREENDPILVVSAAHYEQLFHLKAPLTRMLRRQIEKTEYVALSKTELESILNKKLDTEPQQALSLTHFVIPVIIMVRGYYETQMKLVNLGKLKTLQAMPNQVHTHPQYSASFEQRSDVSLKTTNHFIRWLGL